MNYSRLSNQELLDELARAGRKPAQALLQACLERYAEIQPDLLDMLAEEGDPDWDNDDPRWYQNVHAGYLLIAHRAPEAIPLFMEILADPESDSLAEWFETELHHYGPALVAPLLELLGDEDVDVGNRVSTISILTNIANRYPEARQPVINALRRLLPPHSAEGALAVQAATDEEIELWTFVAGGLGDLADKRSLPHVEALHKQGLIDEVLYGDFEDYKREFFTPKGFRRQRRSQAFDIYRAYGYGE